MGLKDLLRSRSKSKGRTSSDTQREASKPTASEPVGSVPAVPNLRSDAGAPGRQSNDLANAPSSQAAAPTSSTTQQYRPRTSSLQGQRGRVLNTTDQRDTTLGNDAGTATSSTPAAAAAVAAARSISNMPPPRTTATSMPAPKHTTKHTLRHEPDVGNLRAEQRSAQPQANPIAPLEQSQRAQQPATAGQATSGHLGAPGASTTADRYLDESVPHTPAALDEQDKVVARLADRLEPLSFDDASGPLENPFVQAEVKSGTQTAYAPGTAVRVQNPDLTGIVDLTNTEDTDTTVRMAPAVVHETVHPQMHHVRHEEITREIHTHDVYHRILPVVDVQVLPARHFVPSKTNPGELDEVTAEDLPNSAIDRDHNRHWVIAETVSRPSDAPLPGPRRFTAKAFPGTEGDDESWVGEDGVPRTKTTWVHPPTLDDTLQKQGLTQEVVIP